MNSHTIFRPKRLLVLILYLILNGSVVSAQNVEYDKLTLNQAIEIGLQNNKMVLVSKLSTDIAKEREKDISNERLPDINFNASYHRLTNLYQHEDGLFRKPVTYKTYPDMYNFTIDASIPLYQGGRLKAEEGKAAVETHINELQVQRSERDLKLEIITHYLQIEHLKEQEGLILDKIKEDSANVVQVQALQNNGVVTKNEVLRAKLQRSNHEQVLTTVQNDILIAEHGLLVVLSLPEDIRLHIDSEDLRGRFIENYGSKLDMELAYQNNEGIAIADEEVQLSRFDRKLVASLTRPTLELVGDYNLKNPNYMFFPPQPYFYRLGLIGLAGRYNIGNLYKSKQKKHIVEKQLSVKILRLEEEKEKLNHQVFKAYHKLKEADDKIKIAEEAIEQAQENYQIVKAKYANQLSLITELMDADNTFLEAESNLISNKIDKQLKYYQLQYALGEL